MKKINNLAIAIGVVSALSLPVTMVPDKAMAATCSNATLNGSYALQLTGFDGTQAPYTPVAAVLRITFAGNGNYQGSGYQSIGGAVQQINAKGTYAVKSNCTVRFEAKIGSATLASYGVIVDDARKIYAVRIDNGATRNIIYEKVSN